MEKYENKGLTGLANLGNTCFLNSTLQCISHTYCFNDFLDKKSYEKKLNKKYDSLILMEWDNLRQMMWKENCIISPGKFVNTIRKVAHAKQRYLFTGFAQNDLPEFLSFLVECFHESINREVIMNINGNIENSKDELAVKSYTMYKNMYAKDYSEILYIFYGIHVLRVLSKDKHHTYSEVPEAYFLLSLPIPNKKDVTLIDCFDEYTKAEVLEEENQYQKDDGEKVDALREIKFWNLPKILVIDLKRFSNINKKNKKYVDFPLEQLNLSKYVIGYKKKYIYDLYGICNHGGNVSGGHYTSYVKNANGNWYHFNDTHVQKVMENELITNKAYCFFYKKREEQ